MLRALRREARKGLLLNANLRRLLKDLRDSISKAFSESNEVSQALHRIRDEGWSLYLVVDRKKENGDPQSFELSSPRPKQEEDPSFRINGKDLSFLKSVGIDPTRKLRRRRSN